MNRECSITGGRVPIDAEKGKMDLSIGAGHSLRSHQDRGVEELLSNGLEHAEDCMTLEILAGAADALRCGARDALGKRPGLVETSEAIARHGALREYDKAGTVARCLTESFDDLVEIVLYPCQADIHLHRGDLHRFTPKLSLNAYASASTILRCARSLRSTKHLS